MEAELVWDKKRVFVGLLATSLIVGGGYLAKIHVLDKRSGEKRAEAKTSPDEGRVAGTNVAEEEELLLPSKADLEKRIEIIKKEITELKPEDVAKQEPVKKIITDLENLKSGAEKGVKDAVCEEVKKLLCPR